MYIKKCSKSKCFFLFPLPGKGVAKNQTAAMEWFKKASDQGHPHAAYNLAVGHLQGYHIGLKPGLVQLLFPRPNAIY